MSNLKYRKGVNKGTIRAIESGDMQSVLDALTVKQRRFVEEYIQDLDPGAAVLRAGYKAATKTIAQVQGNQLLKHPGTRTAIDALLRERANNSDITADYVLKKIVKVIEKCEKDDTYNATAVLRAAELLGKHLAMFTEKHEHTGADGGAIQFEKIKNDADEFTRAIARLANRAGETEVDGDTKH